MCASPNNSTDGDNKGVRVQQRRAGLYNKRKLETADRAPTLERGGCELVRRAALRGKIP